MTNVVRVYRIMNRVTRQFADVEAGSAQEACEKVGWMIGECWVRERTSVVKDSTTESGKRGGGWADVTPRR